MFSCSYISIRNDYMISFTKAGNWTIGFQLLKNAHDA